jgi:hypothetical protein
MVDFLGKRYLLGLGLGVSMIGALYGWYVYAGEIENDIGIIVSKIATLSQGKFPLDGAAVQLEAQVANTAEKEQNAAIEAGLYSAGPLAGDPTATRAANILTTHFANYCDPAIENGTSCPSDVLLQYGDAKISTILSGTAYSAARQAAVTQFLYNLIPAPTSNLAPFVVNGKTDISQFPTTLPKNDPNSSAYPNPQLSFAQTLTDQAMLSIARQPFSEMIAKRSPAPSGGDTMMQMMDRVASQRFLSTEWSKSLNPPIPPEIASLPNNEKIVQNLLMAQSNNMLQEMTLMNAYHVWLEYERYRQMERVEALLAALVIQNYNNAQAVAAQVANQPSASSASTSSAATSSADVSTAPPAPPPPAP